LGFGQQPQCQHSQLFFAKGEKTAGEKLFQQTLNRQINKINYALFILHFFHWFLNNNKRFMKKRENNNEKMFCMKFNSLCFCVALFQFAYSQNDTTPFYKDEKQEEWVNKTYNNLTLDEKIGQLFMVSAYSNKDTIHENEIKKLIVEEKIGGLIFMQDNAVRQVQLTNLYQNTSKTPLIISMDAEWGVSMRLKNTNKFPWAMTLGATKDEFGLTKKMGRKIAEHCKRLGVHINFAPVVDINTNAQNPIIGNRSFGSDKENVSKKAIGYMNGMRELGVLASAKHFPGHGDTDKDSHKTLPSISHPMNRLENIELYPFKQLIEAGIGMVMVAHLNVPAIESEPNLPSSLSKKVITDLLKNKLNFGGLIITDALNMQGVAKNFSPGDIDLRAFESGNDILLFSQEVKMGKQKIREAIEKDSLLEKRLEESVKKILWAKYFVGLNDFQPIKEENLLDDLNDAQSLALTEEIFEKAITLVKNNEKTLPIQSIYNKKIAYVSLEEGNNQVFYEYLKKYAQVDKIEIANATQIHKLSNYDFILIGIHKETDSPYKSYVSSENTKAIVAAISQKHKSIVCLFTSPYGLKSLDLSSVHSVLVGYQNTNEAQKIMPQIIFGAKESKGVLPVEVNESFKYGLSIENQSIGRLGYALPENVFMSSVELKKVDEAAQQAIEMKATPGLQILVARKGNIIYEKAFGYHTYENQKKVLLTDLYDLASVTKITTTIPLLMQEVGNKNLSINAYLGDLLPQAKGTNKEKIGIKEILAHQSGLPDWIGFYKETVNVENARLYLDYYSRTPSKEFSIKITDNIYLLTSMKDSIYNKLYKAPLGQKKYQYSDLGYYFLQDYLEKKNQKTLDIQANENLFEPLEMYSTSYKPIDTFPLDRIIPTEKDRYFRNKLLHGIVHDQGTAMMGGVAGHAGLFSNAPDLSKMLFMFLNKGEYAGKKIINENIINQFTQQQFKENANRRGLGFDKKRTSSNQKKNKIPSEESYGHLGYTGTMIWVDPKYELIYIFLSNRLHPDDRKTLTTKQIRENIHQLFYDAILN
jgi:beta-N-acetylhexosaminidase